MTTIKKWGAGVLACLMIFSMFITATPKASAADDAMEMRYQACVSAPNGLRLRKTASNSGKLVTVLPRNARVIYYPSKVKGVWIYVKCTIGKKTFKGWCAQRYLVTLSNAGEQKVFLDYDISIYSDSTLKEECGLISGGTILQQVDDSIYRGQKKVMMPSGKKSKVSYTAIPVKYGKNYGYIDSSDWGIHAVPTYKLTKSKAKKSLPIYDKRGKKTGACIVKDMDYYTYTVGGKRMCAQYFRGVWMLGYLSK